MFRTALLASAVVVTLAACASSMSASDNNAATDAEAAAESSAAPTTASLADVIAGSWRDPKNIARDGYRHPQETLSFFGVAPTQTVIEITPGGGWYAEILAPYLRESGRYVAAVVDPAAVAGRQEPRLPAEDKSQLETKFARRAGAVTTRASVVAYDPKAPSFGAPASADVVLTFRNVHNWRMAEQAEGMFKGFFAVLKPGGMLGVVEHRAKAGTCLPTTRSGYVGEAQVIAMAQAAGFELDAKSEVNANPKDTKDHPNGVWTLPPVNDHDAEDDAKYTAIGESDRMTLRFVKPAQ